MTVADKEHNWDFFRCPCQNLNGAPQSSAKNHRAKSRRENAEVCFTNGAQFTSRRHHSIYSPQQTQNLDLNYSGFQSKHCPEVRSMDRTNQGNAMANLTINGKTIDVDVEADTPLLWAIRENVGLTGTKYGCGIAQCGACTVHIDGVAMRSCGVLVSEAAGKQITTIEGLATNGALHKVQQAWINNDVPQCGYCQSGMIMAVAALLKDNPKPTDADIDDAITNICRCGTFQQVREAIHAAANV
jgi:isoquinoline 1-oxidoreductase subunit alpha